MAGYGQATGDYIISLDDDGQTPASESFKLVDKLEEGYDVVYGYYEHSAQHLFRRFGTWINKKMAEAIIGQRGDMNMWLQEDTPTLQVCFTKIMCH